MLLINAQNYLNMFSFFKRNPIAKLEKQYLRLMEEARDIQRSGDLKAYARKIAESEELLEKIDTLKAANQEK
jgi:hypothetical protein